ncbi:protein ANTAGONIST OF LIKE HETEROCHROMATIN PROTEIN 1 [Elysia marginata]|uniref:Protein ANTAGONIST OF LIKE HETEROCHROMATIN PROTEIN 1 n=1 Tax=Elysia marginata TaxID=1093978 RepID=A0AAV4FUA1_9GAST|nr:protein ANTAGONIST OF LIKE HETEROCHROMATIN PROTEIN 1 [Elysia marginata]
MSRRSITRHIYQTYQVLWDVLQPLELKPPTKDQWFKIARRFGDLWDFPFAVGAIDGKHIALNHNAPTKSGSMYYCYKGFPSIVLMAVSDADSCFILVDCGQYGRISDAGVYRTSQISKLLKEGKLNIPTSEFKVNSTRKTIPFMIVGDEAFPLKTYLLKPYAAKTLDQEKRIYNYRHSRARRTVECAFGILAKKFEIFQRPLRVEPDKAVLLTNAALVLHNFIRRRDGRMVDRTADVTYEVVEGQGRGMFPLEAPTHGGRPSAEAMAIRDSVKTFFNDPQGGTVPWQHENVFRNVIANEID